MSITAIYHGECAVCGGPIVPGSLIEFGGMDETYAERWAHVECPKSADELALAVPRCARCGLNHPGEC